MTERNLFLSNELYLNLKFIGSEVIVKGSSVVSFPSLVSLFFPLEFFSAERRSFLLSQSLLFMDVLHSLRISGLEVCDFGLRGLSVPQARLISLQDRADWVLAARVGGA